MKIKFPHIKSSITKARNWLPKTVVGMRPALPGGPTGLFPTIYFMETGNPQGGNKQKKSSDGIKDVLLDLYRKKYPEWELKDLKTAFELLQKSGIDLTNRAEGVEFLIAWDADLNTLAAFLALPLKKNERENNFSSEVLKLISRFENLANFPFNYHLGENAAGKYLNMLILREEGPEALLLKAADLFQAFIQTPTKSHPEAALALYVYTPFLKLLEGEPSFSNSEGVSLVTKFEDLAFLNFDPERYSLTESQKFNLSEIRKSSILNDLKALSEIISESFPQYKLNWRVKGIYSTFKKEREVNDLFGIKVVVPDDHSCYLAQSNIGGVMKGLGYKRIGRLCNDYIAQPKKSGYQALHEVYESSDNSSIEIQIKTEKMNREATVGRCSHLKYKFSQSYLANLPIEMSNAHERYDVYRKNLLDKKIIFAYDADGIIHKIGPLTRGENFTVLDFAFHLSRYLGSRCSGASIHRISLDGGRKVIEASYSSPIENGDFIALKVENNPMPINKERCFSANTPIATASLELLKRGREIDNSWRFDQLKSEGERLFQQTIDQWRHDILEVFDELCPNISHKKFIFSLERIYKKIGFEDLDTFHTAIGLKRQTKGFLKEVYQILKDSSVVIGCNNFDKKSKEINFYALINDHPGVLLRLLEIMNYWSLELTNFQLLSRKENFILILLKAKTNDISKFSPFLTKLQDLYKHIPLVTLIPLQKRIRLTAKIRSKEFRQILIKIWSLGGNILSGGGKPTFLGGKIKIDLEISTPVTENFQEKLDTFFKKAGIKGKIVVIKPSSRS